MKTITVVAKKDCLERLATVAPMKALSELIWNGLDAGSDLVEVEVEQNKMSGLERILVRDHGTGIPHDKVEAYFGDLGNSWKSAAKRFKGRSLHGSRGEGRFKAFALGNLKHPGLGIRVERDHCKRHGPPPVHQRILELRGQP